MSMKGKGSKPLPFGLYDNEYFVQCPYNLAHQVTNSRMMIHLPKCRRNYVKDLKRRGETLTMSKCQFNPAHSVMAPEIDFHEQSCEDRFSVVPHLFNYEYATEFEMNVSQTIGAEMLEPFLATANDGEKIKNKVTSSSLFIVGAEGKC